MMKFTFSIALTIGIAFLSGCGPKYVLHDVKGTVTYNGKPLNDEGCSITFLSPTGKDATAKVAPTGEYLAKGVVEGPNTVAVYYSNPEAAKPRSPGEKAPKSTSPLRNLPMHYADPKTSKLTVEVAAGTVYDVDLKGPTLK
ncbi:hypothetical protein [Frigoriglobus tundricola]|uniref:Carboxypeptidase regulatory-like domain-containing protein n=1 Tax=Frigoriglobus tundricola TaxID=2774151 RepID=A0A6M5Z4P0_9BACT|nr:hypothetical protein [Frigoriglobus tundricola]QJX00183.1 hypothetical protein FTUN_7807 [Frigoriglobus tundricola]